MDAVSFITASLSSGYTMAIENVTKQHNTNATTLLLSKYGF